jgi:MFS family permease
MQIATTAKRFETAPERRWLGLRLLPGVSPLNLTTYYYAALSGLCLFVLLGAIQPFVLTNILNVPFSEQGRVTGRLGFFQELTLIATIGLFGVLSDKIGRWLIWVGSFIVIGLSYWLYPSAGSVDQLLVFRMIFAVGAAAYSGMLSTVLADYVVNEDRGKATGYMGVCNGVGAMLAVTVMLNLPRVFQRHGMEFTQALRLTFYIAAIIAAVSAMVLLFGLKRGVVAQATERKSFEQLACEGLLAAKDPGVALAYVAAFVSRGDLALVGQFLVLWLNKYGLEEAGLREGDAVKQAQLAIVIVQAAALLAAPLVGWMADRLNRVVAVVIAVSIAAVGYSSLFFIQDPMGGAMKVALLLVGVGEIGGVIASQALIAQQAPRAIRGSVIGVYGLCGALGILTAFSVGGYLFDHWRESAPFFLFGLFGAIVALWGWLIRRQVKPPLQERSL